MHCAGMHLPKKEQFSLQPLQVFYTFTTVFTASKSSFIPNLMDVEEKNDFISSMTPFWPQTVAQPKSTEIARLAL